MFLRYKLPLWKSGVTEFSYILLSCTGQSLVPTYPIWWTEFFIQKIILSFLLIFEYISIFFSKRPLSPPFNVAECEVASIGNFQLKNLGSSFILQQHSNCEKEENLENCYSSNILCTRLQLRSYWCEEVAKLVSNNKVICYGLIIYLYSNFLWFYTFMRFLMLFRISF